MCDMGYRISEKKTIPGLSVSIKTKISVLPKALREKVHKVPFQLLKILHTHTYTLAFFLLTLNPFIISNDLTRRCNLLSSLLVML